MPYVASKQAVVVDEESNGRVSYLKCYNKPPTMRQGTVPTHRGRKKKHMIIFKVFDRHLLSKSR